MSPVDKDTISYLSTSLADRVPLPAPGFPNTTILNTLPSLPVFAGSSFVLVALRNKLREEMAEGVNLLSLDAAEPQCLDVRCKGDASISEGKEGELEKVWERGKLEDGLPKPAVCIRGNKYSKH